MSSLPRRKKADAKIAPAAKGVPTLKRPMAKQFKFGYLVHDVSRVRRTLMDQAMRPHGVTRSQWSVLSALSRGGNDGMMQVDLARLLEVGKVTVGGLVDRLEATGHVERRADATDRRAKRVFITEQGFEVIRQMIIVASKINQRILKGVSPEELQFAEDVLIKVKNKIREILNENGERGKLVEFGSQLNELELQDQD
ncbi:MAG: MarR family transcriptional regulator [Caulobacterales bacterium]